MRSRRPSQVLFARIALLSVLTLAACDRKTPQLTEQEQRIMTPLITQLQTHCFGRFLIDLPAGVDVGTQQTTGHNRKVIIRVTDTNISLKAFHEQMKELEATYRAKKHREGWDYFYDVQSPNQEIYLFERLESETENTEVSRAIEGYKWSNNTIFQMITKATDVSSPKAQNHPILKQLSTDTGEKKALITKLLNQANGRKDNEIPTSPGLCFKNGFLAIPATDEEEFDATVDFKNFPDVSLRFKSDAGLGADDTLLQRKDLHKFVDFRHGNVLRKGIVQLSGITQAEEWLVEAETEYDSKPKVRGHYFTLEGNSKSPEYNVPFFSLTLETAGLYEINNELKEPTKSSLSDAEALALWDAITRTIRMRPGAF